jgi:hypothetical protein
MLILSVKHVFDLSCQVELHLDHGVAKEQLILCPDSRSLSTRKKVYKQKVAFK